MCAFTPGACFSRQWRTRSSWPTPDARRSGLRVLIAVVMAPACHAATASGAGAATARHLVVGPEGGGRAAWAGDRSHHRPAPSAPHRPVMAVIEADPLPP